MIKRGGCCKRRTDRQTQLEEELSLQKFHGIICPQGERKLRSDLYAAWTGIPSSM